MSDQWDDYDDDEDATCYHEELSEPNSEFRHISAHFAGGGVSVPDRLLSKNAVVEATRTTSRNVARSREGPIRDSRCTNVREHERAVDSGRHRHRPCPSFRSVATRGAIRLFVCPVDSPRPTPSSRPIIGTAAPRHQAIASRPVGDFRGRGKLHGVCVIGRPVARLAE